MVETYVSLSIGYELLVLCAFEYVDSGCFHSVPFRDQELTSPKQSSRGDKTNLENARAFSQVGFLRESVMSYAASHVISPCA